MTDCHNAFRGFRKPRESADVGPLEAEVMLRFAPEMLKSVEVRREPYREIGPVERQVLSLFALDLRVENEYWIERWGARRMAQLIDSPPDFDPELYCDAVDELKRLVRKILKLEIDVHSDGRLRVDEVRH